MRKPVPPSECALADYTKADVIAIQALFAGVADAEQQKRDMDFIVNKICRTYDLTYRPHGDTHASAFAAGRAYSGQQLVTFLKMSARTIKE